ncbi:MAG TPA: M36 family metallopeptidase, partial [Thermoanaerobaculia bacterium]
RTQQAASVVQLYYDINFLHDWFYDAGFNEAAGNAQTDNYGRGGVGGDNLRAEAHDYSGRNNANMFTPADGGRPRMQMYIFDGIGHRTLQIDRPESPAKEYATGTADFGSQSFELSGDVVATQPGDACTQLSAPVTGKIVFIDRGACGFSTKVGNAQDAGAIGVIIGNTATSPARDSLTTMACGNTPCSSTEITLIPSLFIAFTDAEDLRAGIAEGLHSSMRRDRAIDRDGAIDNEVVAHEWAHYLSNRLIGNGNGLSNNQSRGMGEGWSDFNALLLTVRPEDVQVTSNEAWAGAYAVGTYVTGGGANGPRPNGGSYFGIRRVPYSTDMKRDPLTLRHVGNGASISGAPTSFGADGTNNSEVHNSGEIWATMLWECYASLLRDTLGASPRLTFGEAQQRMKEYLVASLRATPVNPTILEARDALLAVAFARDKTDYQEFWKAFAKRGAGVNAAAPERFSTANLGATEDFSLGGAMTVDAVTLDDSVDACQHNGVLDGGETGALMITMHNSGSMRLEATQVRVTTPDSRVTFANNGSATVPATNPGETASVTFNTSLARTTGIVKPDITINVSDPAIAQADGLKSVYYARLNASEDPEQSVKDDVESRTTAWSATSAGPAITWSRLELTPRDHRWFASEPASVTDQLLVSPSMVVAPTGAFTITFRHRYAFDYSMGTTTSYIDGGVVEMSTDDGQTWNDVGGKASPGYGISPILTRNGSPIEGRLAFEGTSAGFSFESPSSSPFVTTKIDLGTDYAGRRVRFRFRLATAAAHSGAPRLGWEIDDIAFDNILTLPFYGVSGNRGVCGVNASATALHTSVTSASTGTPIMLFATVTSAFAPMGTVDFLDNGLLIGSALIQNGQAWLTTSSLQAGTHSLTAAFAGSTNFSASRSSAVTVLVAPSRHRPAGR